MIPAKKKIACDTISISFHLKFFKRKKWAFHFSKRFLPLLQEKYMLDNVPS
jgi:hypothetical protein